MRLTAGNFDRLKEPFKTDPRIGHHPGCIEYRCAIDPKTLQSRQRFGHAGEGLHPVLDYFYHLGLVPHSLGLFSVARILSQLRLTDSLGEALPLMRMHRYNDIAPGALENPKGA